MKILIVSSRYFPEVGAAPARIRNMAEGLKAKGHDVDVLTCLPNHPKGRIFDGYRHCFSKKETIDGIGVFRYWTYASVSMNPLKRAVSMFSFAVTLWAFTFRAGRIRQYDLVILQTPTIVSAASAMRLFKGVWQKKVILNVSDLWPLTGVTLGAMRENSLSYRYMAHLEKFLYRKADGTVGQSDEILEYIGKLNPGKKSFLYRNVQPSEGGLRYSSVRHNPLRIVYAGMFGIAQNILGIIRNVDFRKCNAELHLYGGGGQTEMIKSYIDGNPDCAVQYHGFISKTDMNMVLRDCDISIVPLSTAIYGAVPSKLFDLMPAGVPVLFCGGGEGARIVEDMDLGLTSVPGDYAALESDIAAFAGMSDSEYGEYVERCISSSQNEFSFQVQMDRFDAYLRSFV